MGPAASVPDEHRAGAAARLVSGEAWTDFCATLAEAGTLVLDQAADDLERAEGFRYLTRLLRSSLERFVENNEPYRPTGFLSVHDLDVDDDGTFEIVCSAREHPGNWLRMEPDTTFVMIRQTFLDRATETPMALHVERIDPEYRTTGGSPDHLMYFGAWDLAPGEALEVRARLPEHDFWNFQACSWWAENFDSYEDGQGYVTKRTATTEPDGRVVLALGPDPLDVPNWIDTFGHRRGTMNLRIVHPRGAAEVETRVVPAG